MDMPFATVSDLTFLDLFTPDEAGVWEIVNGEWTFGEWWYLSSVGWKFEPHADQADQDDQDPEQAHLNDALHFGYETYGQDGPPAPLNYPDYDYEDPRDLD
jgi:hypothetical protein